MVQDLERNGAAELWEVLRQGVLWQVPECVVGIVGCFDGREYGCKINPDPFTRIKRQLGSSHIETIAFGRGAGIR